MMETREWTGPASDIRVDSSGMWHPSVAGDYFSRATTALASGDRAGAESALESIRRLREMDEGTERHSGSGKGGADRVEILRLELEGLLSLDADSAEAAIALVSEAATLDDSLPYEYGPPWPVAKPPRELLGEILLGLKRPADAQVEFEEALYRAPGRSLSIIGLIQAADGAGDADTAWKAYGQLESNWKEADPPVLSELHALREMLERAEAAASDSAG